MGDTTERERWLAAVRSCKCKHGVALADKCAACDEDFDAAEAEQHKSVDSTAKGDE